MKIIGAHRSRVNPKRDGETKLTHLIKQLNMNGYILQQDVQGMTYN